MKEFSFSIEGVESTIRSLEEAIAGTRQKAERGLEDAALAYQRDVQAYPPPIDTGQYRASVRTEPVEHDGNGNPFVRIGSPAPQAARLEFGYGGPDSLGRRFNQRPRPHWFPVMEANKEKYKEIIMRAVDAQQEGV